MPVTEHLLFSGRVQGVGFRWTLLRLAEDLRLGGWVRNLPDGRVEALVQGEAERIERLIETLEGGPGAIRITGIEREAVEARPLAGFSVR